MTLGSCLVSNQVEGLKDALIQARIDGKSWKQIQEEFSYSSVQVARKNFRKITGINDLNIKGKALKDVIDAGMIDTLKVKVPKVPKPKVIKPAQQASVDDFLGPKTTPKVGPTTEAQEIMSEAFPEGKGYLNFTQDVNKYYETQELHFIKDNAVKVKEIEDLIGEKKFQKVIDMLQGGSYYSDIVTKLDVTFEQVDRINFWQSYLQKASNNVWKTYAAKPTSEVGFKYVQNSVNNLRAMGADIDQIVTATGIPKNVVTMITKNTWSLPAKGSKEFVGYVSPKPAYTPSYATGSSQTTYDLIGERNVFNNIGERDATDWYHNLGQDLTPEEVSQVKRFTGGSYRVWNEELRGTNGRRLTPPTEANSVTLSATMRPAPQNMTLYRGVGSDVFPNGLPQPGDSFHDPGFMSASFGDDAAFGGTYELVIDVPAGARARPVHLISSSGTTEREILLDRNQRYIITGTKKVGYSKTQVFMRLIL